VYNQLVLLGVRYVLILVLGEHLLQVVNNLFVYLIHIGCVWLIALNHVDGSAN